MFPPGVPFEILSEIYPEAPFKVPSLKIPPDVSSGIFTGILCGIRAGNFTGILPKFHTGDLSAFPTGAPFDIYAGAPSVNAPGVFSSGIYADLLNLLILNCTFSTATFVMTACYLCLDCLIDTRKNECLSSLDKYKNTAFYRNRAQKKISNEPKRRTR